MALHHLKSKCIKSAIAQNNDNKGAATMHKDLRNCPCYCFGDHQQCRASYCKCAGEGNRGIHDHQYMILYLPSLFESLDELPSGLLRAAQWMPGLWVKLPDWSTTKHAQLIYVKTLCPSTTRWMVVSISIGYNLGPLVTGVWQLLWESSVVPMNYTCLEVSFQF